MREHEIEMLRGVVRDSVRKHLYSSAIFFADKVAAFTNDPADIYMQAQALFLGRHYRRAFHPLNASKKVLRDLRFRYLAAKCLEELKEWDQCLSMLGEAKVDEDGNVSDTKDSSIMYLDKDGEDCEINISAAICFLRGKTYEALENLAQARLWLWNALLKITCLHVRKYEKESDVEAKFTDIDSESCKIDESNHSFLCTLKTNTDLLACKAEYYQQCGEYQKCFELTSVLLEKDPFHLKSTLVHLGAAMELGHSNELYLMACNLVKDYPQNKATSMDGTFPPAWVGMEMLILLKKRVIRLCQLIALRLAKAICSFDPLMYNELGVVAYHMKEYDKAALWFEKTIAPTLSKVWEPTVVNLAHAYRKLKMYHEAISYYEKALALSTKSVSTYVGLAYIYHLQDDFTPAITYYHKALWLKPDDQFCTEMLSWALVDEGRSGVDPKVDFR